MWLYPEGHDPEDRRVDGRPRQQPARPNSSARTGTPTQQVSSTTGIVFGIRIYVAPLDGDVVGFVEGTFSDMSAFTSGEFLPPRARIMNRSVSSARRRNRVGSRLVQRFAAEAQTLHLDSLVLFPDPREPEERMAFFADCGLRPVAGSELLGAVLKSIRTALTERAT
ncbi:GNAT family N-acetyltransferase [Streptomyces chartreusis]